MKKIGRKNKNRLVGGTMFTLLIVGFVAALMINASMFNTVDIPAVERTWKTVGADGDPGAGASGMLEIFIYPHDVDPGTTYASNLSSDNAYASRNTWNDTLTGDVPYDTEFDIVIKARFNTTHAYNTTSSNWDMDYLKALITSADLSIGADTEMSEVQIANNADFIWVNFYMNNAGSGYTRTHGVSTNVTSVKLQGFF